jgi:hypothetical protein
VIGDMASHRHAFNDGDAFHAGLQLAKERDARIAAGEEFDAVLEIGKHSYGLQPRHPSPAQAVSRAVGGW